MALAFVYKWTHIPSMKWYIGSRTNKKAHPDDGYICSSKVVKKMINENRGEWRRIIIEISEDCEKMYDLETELLQLADAARDPRSFNKHNNDGKWLRKRGTSPWNKGKSGYSTSKKGGKYPWTQESKDKLSDRSGEKNNFFGKTHSEESKAKHRETRKLQITTEETKKKMSKVQSELHSTPEYKNAQSERMKQWWANRKRTQNA